MRVRRVVFACLAVAGAATVDSAGAPPARAATYTCTAYASGTPGTDNCTFSAVDPATSVITGYVSASNGPFTISVSPTNLVDPTTRQLVNWEGQACQIVPWNRPPGVSASPGTVNAAHTVFTASGPGTGSVDLTPWCYYTLKVTSGAVGAGEAGEETAA